MSDWLLWVKNMFFQREHDERTDRIEQEVAQIRETVDALKERTEALEAFNKLAQDAPQ